MLDNIELALTALSALCMVVIVGIVLVVGYRAYRQRADMSAGERREARLIAEWRERGR